MTRQERLERLRAVEREYLAAVLAVDFLREGIQANAGLLHDHSLRPRDAENFAENLEATYLLRLFAEFEAALRDFWTNGCGRKSAPATRVLIDSVATRCGVPEADVDDVHRTRAYRNSLVHEGGDEIDAVTFSFGRSAFGRFLARLPLDW